MHHSTQEVVSTSKTEIKVSGISGKGTFAKVKINPGEYIFTLWGELVQSDPNVDHLCTQYGVSGDDPLQVGDAQFVICNHESKTINHSCNPNTGLRNTSDLYAIREINPGEEITYDYSTTSGVNDVWTMSCGCGSEACRKIIGNALTIPPIIIAKYANLDVIPDFIRQQLRQAQLVL